MFKLKVSQRSEPLEISCNTFGHMPHLKDQERNNAICAVRLQQGIWYCMHACSCNLQAQHQLMQQWPHKCYKQGVCQTQKQVRQIRLQAFLLARLCTSAVALSQLSARSKWLQMAKSEKAHLQLMPVRRAPSTSLDAGLSGAPGEAETIKACWGWCPCSKHAEHSCSRAQVMQVYSLPAIGSCMMGHLYAFRHISMPGTIYAQGVYRVLSIVSRAQA